MPRIVSAWPLSNESLPVLSLLVRNVPMAQVARSFSVLPYVITPMLRAGANVSTSDRSMKVLLRFCVTRSSEKGSK